MEKPKESSAKLYSKIFARSLPGSYFFSLRSDPEYAFRERAKIEAMRLLMPLVALGGDYILSNFMHNRGYLTTYFAAAVAYPIMGNLPTMLEYGMFRKPGLSGIKK